MGGCNRMPCPARTSGPWAIPAEQLEFYARLAAGAFGEVWSAEWNPDEIHRTGLPGMPAEGTATSTSFLTRIATHHQLFTTLHAPCGVLSLVTMVIGR